MLQNIVVKSIPIYENIVIEKVKVITITRLVLVKLKNIKSH
jgi:hypothetical protein